MNKAQSTQVQLSSRALHFIHQRIQVIASSVGADTSAVQASDSGPWKPALAALEKKFVQMGFSAPARLQLLYLALWGRYPSRLEYEPWLIEYLASGFEGFMAAAESSHDFRLHHRTSRPVKLTRANRSNLHVDVSHTLEYPYNSGIQRVVRKLAEQFEAQKKPVVFFRIDVASGQPVPLSTGETQRLLGFQKRRVTLTGWGKLKWILHDLTHRLPKLAVRYLIADSRHQFLQAYHRFRSDILWTWAWHFKTPKAIFDWIDRHKVGFKNRMADLRGFKKLVLSKSDKPEMEVLFFLDSHILVPELIVEYPAMDFYLALKSTGIPNELAVIIYDLIPVIAPEYCVVQDKFVQYLRVLRVADRASCISLSVMKDMENFSKMLLREGAKPLEISCLYLGGDFASSPAGTSPVPAPAIPRIICVGTFEPRKNQIAVLRAAYLLHKKGLNFNMTFVGNPGWKNELFDTERVKLDPDSKFTSVYHSATDVELDALYQSSRFSMFCSFVEGFGLPIIESLQRGKPVVASNRGSMLEIGQHVGGCVFIDPTDVMTMSAAMEKLLTDDEFHRARVAEIRATQGLTWSEYADGIYSFSVGKDVRSPMRELSSSPS